MDLHRSHMECGNSRTEAYIIGGGVSKTGTFLTEMIQKHHDVMSPMSTQKAKVVLAELGNDAGIYGAARLILG